ncbi:type 1 glutamine amidotransferase [Primorskyibacter sp. S87]|uniref:type 1 glutamine amidotransferase n=1 Tax=Primorskyibacter sp. S87 TaxID=3415126 RepID=UPI003C7A4209
MQIKHLAILMTNTDESSFAHRHPKDGVKFTDLIQMVRPDWTLEVFPVKDGVFPEDLFSFDGLIITGSPASVGDNAPWISDLVGLIKTARDARIPMFGACFGHQAIALALGGKIGPNPNGWVHGLTRNSLQAYPDWTKDLPEEVKLYASHKEQVVSAPAEATVLSSGPDCPISGFVVDRYIYTTQHHPEMTPGFIAALTDEMQEELGQDAYETARASLTEHSDQRAFAESIARFFEQAS